MGAVAAKAILSCTNPNSATHMGQSVHSFQIDWSGVLSARTFTASSRRHDCVDNPCVVSWSKISPKTLWIQEYPLIVMPYLDFTSLDNRRKY